MVNLLQNLRFALAKNFLPLAIIEKYLLAWKKILVYEFDFKDVSIVEADPKMTIRQACLDDMERLVEMRLHDKNLGEDFVRRNKYPITILERLNAGNWCFVAEKGTEIIGYVWVAFGGLYINETESRIALRIDEAILYDWYVSFFRRKKTVGQKLFSQSIICLGRRGYGRICCLVSSYNKPSRRALKKINGKVRAALIFLKFLAIHRLLQTSDSTGIDLRDNTITFAEGTVGGAEYNSELDSVAWKWPDEVQKHSRVLPTS